MQALFILLFIGLYGCAGKQVQLVDLATVDSSITVKAKYNTNSNFVGKKIDGYHANKCLLTEKAANSLAKVQSELKQFELSLIIFDCYRPQTAVNHFARWAKDLSNKSTKKKYYPNEKKEELFDRGYIAYKSGHSRGSTVDLSIHSLKMGTPFDFFDTLSNTKDPRLSQQERANRMLLKLVMNKHGFKNYSKEWWHYTLREEKNKTEYLDVPVK